MSKHPTTLTAGVVIALSICSIANAGKGGGTGGSGAANVHKPITIQRRIDLPSVKKKGSTVKSSTQTGIKGESQGGKNQNEIQLHSY